MGVIAGLKPSFYDCESKVENRAGQPVGRRNMLWGEKEGQPWGMSSEDKLGLGAGFTVGWDW